MMRRELVTAKEVMEVLGVGRCKLRTLAECGVLEPIHLVIDEHGRPQDRPRFRLVELEAIVGKTLEM